MWNKDFLENRSVFFFFLESELVKARKQIKNILIACLLKNIKFSKREGQVYTMFYYKNLTHKEISKKLSISYQASRNYLFKANRKLHRVLKVLEENKNERWVRKIL